MSHVTTYDGYDNRHIEIELTCVCCNTKAHNMYIRSRIIAECSDCIIKDLPRTINEIIIRVNPE